MDQYIDRYRSIDIFHVLVTLMNINHTMVQHKLDSEMTSKRENIRLIDIYICICI